MTNILITGGSGFMGRAIVEELTDPSCPIEPDLIRIFDVHEYKGPDNQRIQMVTGDIRDYTQVAEACRDIDVVIHSAAIVDWGTKSDEEIFSVNVEGTRNILRACREQKGKALVFTSSLDAVFNGKPLVDIDESLPYPETHSNSYCTSKYRSEKLVMENSGNGLRACIIRPSDVYGEGDPYHIGSLIEMAKGGFYIRLGNGKSKCQHVYAGNIAWAHVLAAHAMLTGNKTVDGNVYFITDGPGSNFFSFYDQIIRASGYRIWPKNLWIPRGVAMALGFLSEALAVIARPFKRYTPKMSRFAVTYTCTDFTFNSEKAKRDFGFVPKYSREEAFARTVQYYKNLLIFEK
jgi:nucleoside-diphosphate-sugar epimerase